MEQKRYIIKKFVMANSCMEAIKKDKKSRVDEVFIDKDWVDPSITKKIGFK
jgi:hypothetical protein